MAAVTAKVQKIFERLVGDRAAILRGDRVPAEINDRITSAIRGGELGSSIYDPVKLDGIGFHLVDWNSDAAFIVAMLLYPDEFTDEEIREGVELFLVHAPAHCLEAARLGGYSTDNPFVDEDDEDLEKVEGGG
ncbi:MAG: hypothetical protein AAF591_16930 [Verrucomicrobiota bacterium]